jgi:DNA-binding response OmpR family regulator
MKNILLVDDHPDIRRLVRLTLGNAFNINEAEDGDSGLAMAREFKPDLMVLDVMMPGSLSGLDVLDALKADPQLQQIHVILVTAKGQEFDREEGLRRGAVDYFVKPFSPLKLATRIKELMAD